MKKCPMDFYKCTTILSIFKLKKTVCATEKHNRNKFLMYWIMQSFRHDKIKSYSPYIWCFSNFHCQMSHGSKSDEKEGQTVGKQELITGASVRVRNVRVIYTDLLRTQWGFIVLGCVFRGWKILLKITRNLYKASKPFAYMVMPPIGDSYNSFVFNKSKEQNWQWLYNKFHVIMIPQTTFQTWEIYLFTSPYKSIRKHKF